MYAKFWIELVASKIKSQWVCLSYLSKESSLDLSYSILLELEFSLGIVDG